MAFDQEGTKKREGLRTGSAPAPEMPEDVMELDPILRLKPGSDLHNFVRDELLKKIRWSERKMSQFYPRWRDAESRLQAYVVPTDQDEQDKKDAGGEGRPPEVYNIVVPYAYSTLSTICTYLMQTFAGRDPIFPLKSYKTGTLKGARLMEQVLQHGLNSTNFQRHLWNFLWNGQIYGLSIFRTLWKKEMKHRTRWVSGQRIRGLETVFEGNENISIDPFNFFPDPSVPMVEVAERGEFCWWRTFEGRHDLLLGQADGLLHWVENIGTIQGATNFQDSGSQSSLRADGDSNPNEKDALEGQHNVNQVDQGTVWIIPKEMGLGESQYPQRWLFTVVNKTQIVQAEPFETDHEMHPVSVSEPYAFGQGFGNLGMVDFIGPIQDSMSWLINSHMDSVREILNNTFVVDPHRVEMQDFKQGERQHGRLIRLKSTAIGSDVRTAIQQLAVQDVTQNHINDMRILQEMGDAISGVNDNLRGLQDPGGRKTATEVRISGEAGASRMATLAKVISVQALRQMANQMIFNIHQFMEESFYLKITGKEGQETPLRVFPDMLVGDFHYVPHDGTLPLDRVATVEAWVQLIQLIAGDKELRGNFDFVSLVEHVGELAGARGVEEFRVNVQEMGPGQGMPAGAMPIGGPGANGQRGPQEGPANGPGGDIGQSIAQALGASAGGTTGMGAGGPVGT